MSSTSAKQDVAETARVVGSGSDQQQRANAGADEGQNGHRRRLRDAGADAGAAGAHRPDPIRSENRIKAKSDCNGRRPQRGNYL